jgi:hypothetical protein
MTSAQRFSVGRGVGGTTSVAPRRLRCGASLLSSSDAVAINCLRPAGHSGSADCNAAAGRWSVQTVQALHSTLNLHFSFLGLQPSRGEFTTVNLAHIPSVCSNVSWRAQSEATQMLSRIMDSALANILSANMHVRAVSADIAPLETGGAPMLSTPRW